MDREQAQKVVEQLKINIEVIQGRRLEPVDYFLEGFKLAENETQTPRPTAATAKARSKRPDAENE